ncbi:MAG TPA: hypothetical protein PK054_01555 [Anaerohalosphaeraceae bacterium]|nr:hypothetical protein [Anaerohalosphaeraceae bacterium]HOL89464.1 hypothetical protein [Anaerohalosphaeraceae bacterium]HOQ05578.1 hypothetical protein [Anaerohalosphaeraceae bacterium]HPP55247.1 hypothetical protein [Anaerohalosphaeraceae bacterium]
MKRLEKKPVPWLMLNYEIKVYPNLRSCVKPDMNRVKPEQMPPLMVRKAGWRR